MKFLFIFLLLGCHSKHSMTPPKEEHQPITTIPAPVTEARWFERHEAILKNLVEEHPEVIFVGDSLTQFWEQAGSEVWKENYHHHHPVNMGIAGDKTQNLLWRLEHVNWQETNPKLAILLIGSNNLGSDSAGDIAAGIEANVHLLLEKKEKMKILVLSIFPRIDLSEENQKKIRSTSEIISKKIVNPRVTFLDISSIFLDKTGSVSTDVMYDGVHLTSLGYEMWAKAMKPQFDKLLEEEGQK